MKWLQSLSIALLTSLLLAPVSLRADSGGLTVTTNSVLLIGRAGISSAAVPLYPAWATNAVYTQGQYFQAGSRVYFTLVAGTSSNSGAGPSGPGDIRDGATVIQRACPLTPRNGLAICNNATNAAWDVYVSDLKPAAIGKGFRIGPQGGSLVLTGPDCPQGELYIIMSAGSGNISTSTW